MNRRQFIAGITSLVVAPPTPISIREARIVKLQLSTLYGKFGCQYLGGRVLYWDTDSVVITRDIRSEYPKLPFLQ